MARSREAAAKNRPTVPRVVGETVMAKLKLVRPNNWNPNVMTPFEYASLKHGLQADGWLPSMALTIWRTNEKGDICNVIIDGEHRWRAGTELGIKEGPMVFLDGLTEAQATAMTIKLDQKRGRFDEKLLGELLREVVPGMDEETRSFDLGIGEDKLGELLHVEVEEEGGVVGEMPSGQKAHVSGVQVFYAPDRHEKFQALVKKLSLKFKTTNVTDTVMEAMRRACASAAAK